jgi:Leucine-rich repeat (LRR) protein
VTLDEWRSFYAIVSDGIAAASAAAGAAAEGAAAAAHRAGKENGGGGGANSTGTGIDVGAGTGTGFGIGIGIGIGAVGAAPGAGLHGSDRDDAALLGLLHDAWGATRDQRVLEGRMGEQAAVAGTIRGFQRTIARKEVALQRLQHQLETHTEILDGSVLGLAQLRELPLTGLALADVPRALGERLHSSLERLHLVHNQLRLIPEHLCAEGSQLSHLLLAHNHIERLPWQVGRLHSLRVLDLTRNKLTDAEFPRPAALRSMGALRELRLAGNELTALPHALVALTGLETLDLGQNRIAALTGRLLPELSNLHSLLLSRNQLTVLPDGLGALSNLRELQLHGNAVTALPPALGGLTALTDLTLHANRLAMTADDWWPLSQVYQLQRLTLHRNTLVQLPCGAMLRALKHLEVFPCCNNLLNQLPHGSAGLELLESCTELDLHENRLRELPTSISAMPCLQVLKLNGNMLGVLPPGMGRLHATLSTLELQDNQLTSLQSDLNKLTNLTSLQLARNYLVALPSSFQKLTALKELQLAGNPFSGALQGVIESGSFTPPSERLFKKVLRKIVDALADGAKVYDARPPTTVQDAEFELSRARRGREVSAHKLATTNFLGSTTHRERRGATRAVAQFLERIVHDTMDFNVDGSVSTREFRRYLKSLSVPVSDDEFEAVLQWAFTEDGPRGRNEPEPEGLPIGRFIQHVEDVDVRREKEPLAACVLKFLQHRYEQSERASVGKDNACDGDDEQQDDELAAQVQCLGDARAQRYAQMEQLEAVLAEASEAGTLPPGLVNCAARLQATAEAGASRRARRRAHKKGGAQGGGAVATGGGSKRFSKSAQSEARFEAKLKVR